MSISHLYEHAKPFVMRVEKSRLVASLVPGFLHALDVRNLASGQAIRLDFSEVTFMDSVGLCKLIRILQKASVDRTIEIFALQPAVKALLQLARLDHMVTVVEKEDDELNLQSEALVS